MLVVSDATPLHALIRIELPGILAALYDQVVIPPAVAGEREAIRRALELKADFLPADDKEARTVARRMNSAIIGAVGILELAAIRG